MMVSNRNLLFQGSIFRFHVCFGGCMMNFWREYHKRAWFVLRPWTMDDYMDHGWLYGPWMTIWTMDDYGTCGKYRHPSSRNFCFRVRKWRFVSKIIYIYGYNISYHVHKSTFSHLISLLSSKYAKKSMHLSLLVLYTTASINNLRTCAVPHVLQNSKPWDHGRMFFW